MAGGSPASLMNVTPFDFKSKMAEQEERAKLVQQLAALGMGAGNEGPTIDAGAYKVANWSAPLKQLAMTLAHNYAQGSLSEDREKLSTEYNRRLGSGIQDYLSTKMGGVPTQIGQDTRALDESGAEGAPPPAMMPSKPDPVRAIANAMASGIGPLQTLGLNDLGSMKGLTQKDILELGRQGYDLNTLVQAAQTGSIAGLKPKGEFHAVGDMGVTTQNGEVVNKAPVNTYTPPKIDPNTNVPVQENPATGKVTGLSGGNVTPAQVANDMAKGLNGATVKQLEEGYKTATSAKESISNLANIEANMRGLDPAKFGTGADFRNNVMKLGQIFGANQSQQTAMMENLQQGFGNLVLENARKLAPVTKEDIGQLQQILGSASTTKQAMEQTVQYLIKVNARSLTQHTEFVNSMKGMPGVDEDFGGFQRRWIPQVMAQGESLQSPGAPQQPFQRAPGAPDPLGLYGGQ
jgi:hypothetical protein